jgi:CBS-domain-containing membrane protein
MSELPPEAQRTADEMVQDRSSLKPVEGANRALRSRLSLRDELVLAFFPTAVVLGVLALVEVLSEQRLLFASLASSAFLIYLDPQHGTNRIRTLVSAQMLAAVLGLTTYLSFGSGYLAAGSAMTLTIFLMVLFDVMHPPAVATALSFALRAGDTGNLLLFALAVGVTAMLVGLQQTALWVLAHSVAGRKQPNGNS